MKKIQLLALSSFVCFLFAFVSPVTVRAGELGSPRIYAQNLQNLVVGQRLMMYFILLNLNMQYSLGGVNWHLNVYFAKQRLLRFSTSGTTTVGPGQEVTVTPEEEFVPTEAGTYTIVVDANSPVNQTGLQKDSITVTVMEPPECPAPTRSPKGILLYAGGGNNQIVFTAPKGCCYEIDPYGNQNSWYEISPTTKQTVSDGQSITFTVSAKDPQPMAAMFQFRWNECDKLHPSGYEYVIVTPFLAPADSGSSATASVCSYYSVFGDPVATASGQFVYDAPTDVSVASSPLLQFTRRYDGGLVNGGFPYGMGPNWQHTFNDLLVGDSLNVIILMSDGRRLGFTKDGGAWKAVGREAVANLQEQVTGWLLTEVPGHVQYWFNLHGRLIKKDNGRIPVHVSWSNGRIDSVYDDLGHTIVFQTDDNGVILSASSSQQTVTYTYTSKGELASVTNAVGETMYYSYTSQPGEIATLGLSKTEPLLQLTYDGDHRVKTQIDATGSLWSYNWTEGTATLTDPDGVKEIHTMNANGLVTSIGTNGSGTMEIQYENGLPEKLRSSNGTSTDLTHHAGGRLASITTSDGTTTLEYAERTWNGATVYDVKKVTLPDGSARSYTYNDRGLCISVTDENAAVWTTTYDDYGNILTLTDPEGRTTTMAYNTAGHPKSISSPSGNTITVTTDDVGNILRADDNGSVRTYERDAMQRVTKFTDEMSHSTALTYSPHGTIGSVTDPLGSTTIYKYGKGGELVSVTLPSTSKLQLAYTKAGRLQTLTDPMGESITLGYGKNGDLNSITDRNGSVTQIETDESGFITEVTTPEERKTSFSYDDFNLLSSVTSKMGSTTAFEYEKCGRIVSLTESSGRNTTLKYDKRGNVARMLIGANIAVDYGYNAAGELTTVTDGNGGIWAWKYDQFGRCISIADPAQREISYGYSARDKLLSVSLPGALGSCTNTYDAGGNLTGMKYSDGLQYHFTRDALGRVIGTEHDTVAYDKDGRMVMSNGMLMKYNANGWLTELTLGPGKAVSYSYDAVGRLTKISDWTGGFVSYEHDDDGQLTKIIRSNGKETIYDYDEDGRLISIADGAEALIELQYNGTRIASAKRIGHLPAAPEAGELVLNVDAGNAITAWKPDAAGRPTKIGDTEFTWNAASQITAIGGGADLDLTYDGFSRLIQVRGEGISAHFVWNDAFGDGFPCAIGGPLGTLYIIPTPGGTFAYAVDSASGQIAFPHFDHQGNAVMYTDGSGSITSRSAYSAYGTILNSEGNNTVPLRFGAIGGMITFTTSLYITPGRAYLPGAGRFISADPDRSIHPQRISQHSYAYCDPVNWADFTGRAPAPITSKADELIEQGNRRLEESMRQTQDKYDAEMRKLEEKFAKQRAEREEAEARRKADEERLARQREEEQARRQADQQKFNEALEKLARLNSILLGPPPAPEPIASAPGTSNGGSASPVPGSGGSSIGGNGQPPSSGGTRVRGTGTNPGGGSKAASGGSSGNGGQGAPGSGNATSQPQPLGPNPTGRGSYNPNVPFAIQYVGAFITGFIEYWTGE